mmetsp:Transcript_4746/g.9943  ORF Transcript_4746/g.9943 Transcript_4746/m.9943 type:complete len:447 (-) Transcript_4746:221-1561(-)
MRNRGPIDPRVYLASVYMVFRSILIFALFALLLSRLDLSIATPAPRVKHDPNSTLKYTLLFGYQGWFSFPSTSPVGWLHWSTGGTPRDDNVMFDAWPDLSEFSEAELHNTSLYYADGRNAKLYSAYIPSVVDRHVQWMSDYGLDGVWLQRFTVDLNDGSPLRKFRDGVLNNVRNSTRNHNKLYAIMYDISGDDQFQSHLEEDVQYLRNLGVFNDSNYIIHKGKPVIAIWGFGFSDRPGTAQQCQGIVNAFKASGLSVVGGVPTHWRTLDGDSKTDPAWMDMYHSFDVISPWTVGRYSDESGVDDFFSTQIEPDVAALAGTDIDYYPVVFPGYSAFNLGRGRGGTPLNSIPRNGGKLYWRQAYKISANAERLGITMMYNAMFDEVDEGTAMYKVVSQEDEIPTTGSFIYLDIDGYSLPSDYYLQLARCVTKAMSTLAPLGDSVTTDC